MTTGNPFSFENLMSACGMNPDGTSKVDSNTAIELAALRNENRMLKDELERYKNMVLKCPCGKKLRIPRSSG